MSTSLTLVHLRSLLLIRAGKTCPSALQHVPSLLLTSVPLVTLGGGISDYGVAACCILVSPRL